MAVFQYSNNSQTTLSGAVAVGATSISVASGTTFPTLGKFTIVVDSEIMLVTGVAGLTWTVQRGVEGTTAAAHNNNATVTGVLTAASLVGAVTDRIGGIDATQRFLKKIVRGIEDVTLVVLGDSTGNDATDWVRLLAGSLAERYLTHTVKYALWDDGTQTYPTPTVLQTGTGPRSINVWNCSVSGQSVVYHLVNGNLMYGSKEPDLVIINHGHNETGIAYSHVRDRMLLVTETVLLRNPQAAIILIGQNPNTTDEFIGLRIQEYERIAQMRGFGFIDVHQAFKDYGNWAADLMSDTVHPNVAGQVLWHDTVLEAFQYQNDWQPRPQPVSTLATTAAQVVSNGDFLEFAAPPTLTDWTASGATLTKNTTLMESTKGYSVMLQATDAAPSQISQSSGGSNAFLNACKGQWVTFAARLRPSDAGASSTAGRVQINDGVAFSTSTGINRYGEFFWMMVSQKIDPAATALTVTVFADSGNNANAVLNVDRVILCRGIVPRDIQ